MRKGKHIRVLGGHKKWQWWKNYSAERTGAQSVLAITNWRKKRNWLTLNSVEDGISFTVEGSEDAQITVGLQDETEYEVFINNESIGKMRTNLGGKLNLSVELSGDGEVNVRVEK